jgi:hypothetical protein
MQGVGQPDRKEVVAKLHYILGDLGLHKGIIVSLAGARSGAQTAARELGIELWGPDELRRHLGEAALTDAADSAPMVGSTVAHAYPFRTSPEQARGTVERLGKGRLGLRTLEPVVWFSPLWMPAYAIRLSVAQPQVKRHRSRLTSTVIDNIVEGLTGEFVQPLPAGVTELPLGGTMQLRPLRTEGQILAALRKAVDALARVTSPAAVQRHEATLYRMGIPVPCQSVTVESSSAVFLPVYAGMLRTEGTDRVVAVDAFNGMVSERLSRVLTSSVTHLRQSFTRR